MAERVYLHVEDSGGAGQAVVLIHGWPLSAAWWDPQRDALCEAGYRVVTYDRRGFGRSDKALNGYDYDTLADDLARVLEERGLQEVTLVAFSSGCGDVARYVTRHGEAALRRVVFVSFVPPCLLQTPDNPQGLLPPDVAERLETGLLLDRDAFFDDLTVHLFSANGVLQIPDAQRRQVMRLCQQSDPIAALGCMAAYAGTDFRPDLARIGVPMLLLEGSSDDLVPLPRVASDRRAWFPHAELTVIPGAPHGGTISHAAAFNAALIDFFRR